MSRSERNHKSRLKSWNWTDPGSEYYLEPGEVLCIDYRPHNLTNKPNDTNLH